jgi:hypothetical protein
MTTRLCVLSALVCGLAVLARGSAMNRADPPEPDEPKRVSEAIEKSVTRYDLFVGENEKPLTPKVVIRWKNIERGDAGDSLLIFWPHNGRPAAMATLYARGKIIAHEFDSLMRDGKLVAREKDQEIWAPTAPGLKFQPVPEAPKPAGTAIERMVQMKGMAGRFKATLLGWNVNARPEQLRLLPRHLFRYDVEKLPDTIDGAAFAFVQGTDPEVILLFEATGMGDKAAWHYALVRATGGGLEVKLDDKLAWEAERRPTENDPKLPHFTIYPAIK